MTDFNRSLQEELSKHYFVGYVEAKHEFRSSDRTRKWLVSSGGKDFEMVFIPEKRRGTLCVSSQVGCSLNCTFCHTGTQPMMRNLTAAEIVGQVLQTRRRLKDWAPTAATSRRRLTHIVMMGQGEPLLNYRAVSQALRIIMCGDGLAIGKQRITVSTAGIIPLIEPLGRELDVNLAVSLHAPNHQLRSQIMPINETYPLADLITACRHYPGASLHRPITFEYVLLKDINDSPALARDLAHLLSGLHAHVNLIRFNPWPNAPYEPSSERRTVQFAARLLDCHQPATIRQTRGLDIMAACGQLKSSFLFKRSAPASHLAAAAALPSPSSSARGMSLAS